jgi:hypothetical protein
MRKRFSGSYRVLRRPRHPGSDAGNHTHPRPAHRTACAADAPAPTRRCSHLPPLTWCAAVALHKAVWKPLQQAMAVAMRGGQVPGVIMHTDQGSEGRIQLIVATPPSAEVVHVDARAAAQVQLYRRQIPSPGRPTVAWREDRVRFWAAIALGVSSGEAAAGIGVSPAVGTRWFRHAGGVGPNLSAAVSGRYLSFREREDIAIWHAERRTRRPKVAKLAANQALRAYVRDRLAGAVTTPDGDAMPGPALRWIGRRHGRRADRRWAVSWSPEQISSRLRVDSPDDESMRVSHEAIYQVCRSRAAGRCGVS